MKYSYVAFLVGFLFALGLGVSGMAQPQNVIGFLDLLGEWNPALAFVMVGAIGTHSLLFRWIMKRKSPILADQFHLPTASDIDIRLLVGAALFGVGWGLGGFCPGPGLTSLASGSLESAVFVSSMLIGMGVFRVTQPLIDRFLP